MFLWVWKGAAQIDGGGCQGFLMQELIWFGMHRWNVVVLLLLGLRWKKGGIWRSRNGL